ncbi:unnamed protein product [Ceutorhynchus assimilis]|uniref:Uncharacterized protein n=1 Tax=Ceutorhynchus assimilis TaxID=467358 RepID=A0A9N9QRF6_9CUCU|nr:unnamed protein product [Ceutorhynchus assimilis]
MIVLLDEERFKKDQNELFHYGVCSTFIYQDYREIIDKQLKRELVNIRNHCKANNIKDDKFSDEKLFERYQQFWALSEPSFEVFYEQIQKIFSVPDDCIPDPQKIYSSALDCARDCTQEYSQKTEKLEDEVRDLIEEYLVETCFVDELKLRQEKINSSLSFLNEKWKRAVLRDKKSVKKMALFEKNHEKLLQMFKPECTREDIKSLLKVGFVDRKANMELNPANLENIKNLYLN